MNLRAYAASDAEGVWQILEPVIRAGETYTLERHLSRQQALQYWLQSEVWVAEIDGQLAGTYYLKRNQAGGGNHVCNCGYMTSAGFRGQGVAKAMCLHSMQMARERGYRAMQFNFVVASNQAALHLWRKLGFQEVGRIPQAFLHPELGYQDALVLHRFL